jgi:hypothetical protein
MKRKKFITAIIGLTATPLVFGIQNEKLSPGEGVGIKIGAGEGRIHGHIKLKGLNSNIIDLKISGKDTKGELALFEQHAYLLKMK